MKGTLKRVMSGVLSVITIASAVAQPITAYAAEPEKAASSFEAQYPELETVKDKLAEDEILIANDYSIDYGSDFDIKVDFSGIEGINDAKVKVELYEAKNEAGDDFDTYQADTYKAVYKVEPVSGNPSYRISRNVTVKEPETEQLTEPNTSENTVGEGNAGETEDSGNAEEDADAEGQTEIVTDLVIQAAAETIRPFHRLYHPAHRNLRRGPGQRIPAMGTLKRFDYVRRYQFTHDFQGKTRGYAGLFGNRLRVQTLSGASETMDDTHGIIGFQIDVHRYGSP